MDDITLIQKIKDGDPSALTALVEDNKNLVWHIIISIIGHTSNSEDIFQEVFLQVYKGVRNFRADSRLSTWIGSITHHVCVDYIRKKKKETGIPFDGVDYPEISGVSTEADWKQVDREDLNKLIMSAVGKLPSDYRTVITLYHFDECSYREISEMTGMPEGTVKSYISRGRNLLRERLIALVPDLTGILDEL
jgi:RNA polymerase sigma factor (sigma-70 family)